MIITPTRYFRGEKGSFVIVSGVECLLVAQMLLQSFAAKRDGLSVHILNGDGRDVNVLRNL